MLRAGLDDAPHYLAEARTQLLDAEARAVFDLQLHSQIVQEALGEFKKLLAFALGENKLREEDENRLYERGRGQGLTRDDMQAAVEAELARVGAERVAATMFVAPTAAPAPAAAPMPGAAVAGDAFSEFRRMLQLSKLCRDGEEMTDDQRDAMCNMGESLGLTGGQAEDLIDEYLDAVSGLPLAPLASPRVAAAGTAVRGAAAPKPVASAPVKKVEAAPVAVKEVNVSPLARAHERQKHPNFTNIAGMEMLLVTSGRFLMGSATPDAAPHEQPVTQVSLSAVYLGRFPVTNTEYERFDPAHKMRRAPWANGDHPVVYVSSRDAEKFCQWLGGRDGRKYRLPTEAEWEYAARGMDDARAFPWGQKLDEGCYANFADLRTLFAWRDPLIDDGFTETAPIGSYPRGASPFGIEEMAGNVFEWCLDYFEPYKGKERTNPRGPTGGAKRIYRGGSWKSRAGNLRTTARNFNAPDYSSNDVGFRVVCEGEA